MYSCLYQGIKRNLPKVTTRFKCCLFHSYGVKTGIMRHVTSNDLEEGLYRVVPNMMTNQGLKQV